MSERAWRSESLGFGLTDLIEVAAQHGVSIEIEIRPGESLRTTFRRGKESIGGDWDPYFGGPVAYEQRAAVDYAFYRRMHDRLIEALIAEARWAAKQEVLAAQGGGETERGSE